MITRKGLLAVLLVVIISVTAVSSYLLLSEQDDLMDSSEFYANSTEYMDERVNSSLTAIGCEGEEFYFDEMNGTDTACFPCGEQTACFGYAEVNRTAGTKFNPSGSKFLEGEYSNNTKFAYYTRGVSKALDCECGGSSCDCEEGIEIGVYNDRFVHLALPDNMSRNEAVDLVSSYLGEECNKTEREFYVRYDCKNMDKHMVLEFPSGQESVASFEGGGWQP